MIAFTISAVEGPLSVVPPLFVYPTKSLVQSSLSIASIYGSEDKVLNREKLEEGRELLPLGFQEYCIEGGNHAWFGNYGEQEGDGTAEISKEEQQEQTVDSILTMIKNRK